MLNQMASDASTGTRMLAAELIELGRVELREVPVPEPGPGELLVRLQAALTCGTDLKTYERGHPKIPLPTPMGHEGSGVVAALGESARGFSEGEPVVWVPTAPCGECRLCRRGRESLCPQAVGRMLFGTFAEYIRLPRHIVEASTFARPEALGAAEAASLEPLACVVHGADRVALDRAESAVILGDGPIGLLFAQVARHRGAGRVLVVGRHAARLDAARALGAEAVATGEDGLAETVRDWGGGEGADVVIECVGRPEAWEQAAGLVAPAGELLAYGGCPAGTRATFDTYRIHYEEVDVKGAFHYGPADVRRALDLLAGGDVRVAPLLTHERPLARLEEALGLVLAREAVKVVVRP